ncbi:uncharacterized protein PY17X_1124700 [Plasmodium yoelii]|uniref:Uncharacterized protein n=3 Tax=Plasmodium yoelii TaxID=5861 RepID=A0AAE9WRK5_PLAYO|nr:uncharacterized protein PY17X_1124700 [Plasmodium yoelii]EAA16309.1 malaria antigen-related [Plasmodium yoelii yoelii]WBY58646.1 hypothetical protein Py17XNL_001105644 [Plasmodium yoelii yoelii]CDU18935.1 conserved Plasmodium protein, unknown function [Plasmodium yoelii]VTZ79520.1 conserved protein, unknown function [Plasmodium yoelii]|eukprot:XP_724744.1 uncharacterized protein PY17X_1124700 [Plasmodium yoelii]
MINIYLILFYLVLICAQNSYAKKIKKYEYINLLSDKDYTEKLNNLRKIYNTKDSNVGLKNKYIYSFYGASGYNKKKILENLFNIPPITDTSNDTTSLDTNFINLGFKQKFDLWFGYDKNNNFNVVLNLDILENKEILDNGNKIIYNYERLINFILETTNSIIIPLSRDDIKLKKLFEKNETSQEHGGEGNDKGMKNDKSKGMKNDKSKGMKNDKSKGMKNDKSKGMKNDKSKGIQNDKSGNTYENGKSGNTYENGNNTDLKTNSVIFNFPSKIELFLKCLNERKKNVHIYFVLLEDLNDDKSKQSQYIFSNFVTGIKNKFNNLNNIYLMKQNKIDLNMIQKNNLHKYKFLVDNVEKEITKMGSFKNFSKFNQKCVYNIYAIEEAYNKTLNHFDSIYFKYEQNIINGGVIKNYGYLSNELLKGALFFFHILTLNQTGIKLKNVIMEKLENIFKALIYKQMLKQLLNLQDIYLNKAKNIILNNNYIKSEKELIENKKNNKIKYFKNILLKELKEDIKSLVYPNEETDQNYATQNFDKSLNEFVKQFEEKLETIMNNYNELNKSPLKKMFEKKKNEKKNDENNKNKLTRLVKWLSPSLNFNLTLTSLIRKSGYGNLQSYFIYDLGMLTLVFGLLNDRDTFDVQKNPGKVPFFKFQPKINLKLNFN